MLEKIVDPINATTTYTNDAYGRRTVAVDPNRGTWRFQYDPLGELVSQTDAKNVMSSFTYDRIGRMKTRSIGGSSTTWNYDTAPIKGIGKLASIASFGNVNESFEYDTYGRLSKSTRSIGPVSYVRTYGYDAWHRLRTIAHQDSTFVERRVYSGFGHWVALRNDVTSGRYWLGTAYEADGQVRTILYGNGLTTNRTYRADMGGVLDGVSTGTSANQQSAQYLRYFYEPGRIGSVYQRFDFNHQVAEGFSYDALNRLRSTYLGTTSGYTTDINVTATSQYTFDLGGNILSKTGVGAYAYFSSAEQGPAHGAHAIKSVAGGPVFTYDNNGNLTSTGEITTSWTAFNQPDTISRSGATVSFTYDADLQRIRQVHGGETVDYAGANHEHRTSSGVDDHVHYLSGPFGRMGQVTYRGGHYADVRYFHHDHLGSVDTITTLDGSAQPQSYDSWGERRSGTTWQSGFVTSTERRGFTDHEELDDVKLVNMNGRVYDPHLGRFLSVDPVYDRLYQTQGVNAYSYVRNNPVSYTDPTGLQTPDSSWGSVSNQTPIQLDREYVHGTNAWDFTRQFGPNLGLIASVGIANAATPRSNSALLNQSFTNCGIVSNGLEARGLSTDPLTPEQIRPFADEDGSVVHIYEAAEGMGYAVNIETGEILLIPGSARGMQPLVAWWEGTPAEPFMVAKAIVGLGRAGLQLGRSAVRSALSKLDDIHIAPMEDWGAVRKPHGNSMGTPGPHDVYVIRDANTGRIYHFGETGRGWAVRGKEWIKLLDRKYGLKADVSLLRTVEGKAAAKALETRYIRTFERAFGQKPGFVDQSGNFIQIQKTLH